MSDQEPEQSKAENLLDTLAEMQAKINESKERISELETEASSDAKFILELNTEKQSLLVELNKFRMGLFIPARNIDPLDIRPLNLRNKLNLLELIKIEGMEAGQSIQRTIIDLAAECSEIVEVSQKKPIKVTLKEKADKEFEKVKKLRETTSPEGKAKKVNLTAMEKAINGIRKMVAKTGTKLEVTTLIPIVMSHMKGSITEVEARTALESIFAKEAKAKG